MRMNDRVMAVCRHAVLWSAALASSAWAQTATVSGRVNDNATRASIAGATVTLDGIGKTLTGEPGEFRFSDVPLGSHVLTVEGLGYSRAVLRFDLRRDTALTISLTIDPLLVDSLRVNARFVSVKGRLTERATGKAVMDGAVFATQNRNARTTLDGRFQFKRVPAGIPFDLQVLAFSYEAVKLSFIPERDTTVLLSLVADTMVQRQIGEQVQRLEKRMVDAVGKGYSVSRKDLLRFGEGTLAEALAWVMNTVPNPIRSLRRGQCVFVDEFPATSNALDILFPEEIERVEYLYDGAMIRIYTRRYMANLVTSGVSLRQTGYSEVPMGFRGRAESPVTNCN